MTSRAITAGAGALVLGVGLAACGASGFKTTTVTVTEKDTNFNGFVAHQGPPATKAGPNGPPQKIYPGDTFSLANDLLNSSKQTVGQINGTCTTTRPGSFQSATVSCAANTTLNGGGLALAAAGNLFGAKSFTGAIVGGTGEYAGAGGTFTITQPSNGPSTDTYHIQIPRK